MFFVPQNSTTIFLKKDSISFEKIRSKFIFAGYSILLETPAGMKTDFKMVSTLKTQIVVDEITTDTGVFFAFKTNIDNSLAANAYSSTLAGVGTRTAIIFPCPARLVGSKYGKEFTKTLAIVYSIGENITFLQADKKGWIKYDISKIK